MDFFCVKCGYKYNDLWVLTHSGCPRGNGNCEPLK